MPAVCGRPDMEERGSQTVTRMLWGDRAGSWADIGSSPGASDSIAIRTVLTRVRGKEFSGSLCTGGPPD